MSKETTKLEGAASGGETMVDARAYAKMQEELAALRKSEEKMQLNLRVMQRHLSEERARVAELHSRLINRSGGGQCERDEVEADIARRMDEEGKMLEPPPGCPAHAHKKPDSGEGGAQKRPRQEDAGATSSFSKLRMPSFREEPLALASLKELAMDSVQEGVTIADFMQPDQPLIYANHGFELITGYSIEETVGHNCRFLQGPKTEPENLMHIRRCINAGLPCTVQLKNYRKNGEEFINHLSLTPIRTAKGEVTHYVGIQSDVTELVNRREAELDAVRKATIAEAATDAKSKFLAHMSHEIRTPLNGLIAVGQLLEETSLNRLQRDYVSTMRSSGETLQALISDILDFSRVEADQLTLRNEIFNPQAVIATVIQIVGLHSARLRLNVGYHVDEGVPELVKGDAMRVQQVLLNTLNNAIKFTEKGNIMIRMFVGKASDAEAAFQRATQSLGEEPTTSTNRQEREEATRLGMAKALERASSTDWLEDPSTSPRGGEEDKDDDEMTLHFYVKDTGIGLSSASLRTIFNSFQQVDLSPTRKYDGTGLGLAISQRLCEAMGGRMWAESPGLGMGSTFHFSIRANSAVPEDADPSSAAPGGTSEAKKEAKKEAAARLAVRASGDTTTAVKTMVRTPSTMSLNSLCKGNDMRVLLYDESKMIRQTLSGVMTRWGAKVVTVDSSEAMIAALGDGKGPCDFDVVVAEKNRAFVQSIRAWANENDQFASKSPRGGVGTIEAGGEAGGSRPSFHCPRFILLSWPVYSRSDSEGESWGGIGGLVRDSALGSPSQSDGGPVSTEIDEEVDEFLSLHNAEVMPKPVQHARLQKILAAVASDLFSTGDSSDRRAKLASVSLQTQTASSKDDSVKMPVMPLGGSLPKSLRILLAEDHHINMKVACAVLGKCGHKDVTIAKDGVEVLEKIEALPSGLDSFDIVLMDLHMPRMGGMECVRQLREQYPETRVPIVAVTADAIEDSRERCLSNGFTAWISKPFRVEQLSGLLDEFAPGATSAMGRAAGG